MKDGTEVSCHPSLVMRPTCVSYSAAVRVDRPLSGAGAFFLARRSCFFVVSRSDGAGGLANGLASDGTALARVVRGHVKGFPRALDSEGCVYVI